MATTYFAWYLPSQEKQIGREPDAAEVATISNILREAQNLETIRIYSKPSEYNRSQLRDYWLMPEDGGREVTEVEKRVNNLKNRGLHYGSGSKNIKFDFRFVDVNGDRARAGTDERWSLNIYKGDKLVKQKNLPMKPDYTLRKVGGKWLIESNSTISAS
ncbi:MAG: hypothetical protein ACO1SV_02640 [Fimbriimonas sp.]